MRFHFVLLFLTLFSTSPFFAQYSRPEIAKRHQVKPYTEHEIDSILDSQPTRDLEFAKIAHSFSYFFKGKDYDLAIKYGKIELNVYETLGVDNKDYANQLFNLGVFYFFKNDIDEAISYFQQAIQSNQWPLKTAQSYCMLARSFRKKGEFYKALEYYHKGLPLMRKLSPENGYVFHATRLAATCFYLDEPEHTEFALTHLNRVDSILRLHPNSKVAKKHNIILNSNIGALYTLPHNYNYQKAKTYYQRGATLAKQQNNALMASFIYNNLADLYLKSGNDSCLYAVKKSMEFGKKKKQFYFESNRILAEYYLKKQDYARAHQYITKAIMLNFQTSEPGMILKSSKQKIINAYDISIGLSSLKTKLKLLLKLYDEQKDTDFLNRVITTVKEANYVANTIINHSSEANTKYLWRKEMDEIFKLGIHASYLMNSPEYTVQFMEANKALLLASDIKSNDQFLQLPKSVVKKYQFLKKQILTLENRSQNSKTPATNTRDSLFNLKKEFQHFKTDISKKYATTLDLTESIPTLDLRTLKSALKNDETVIYYSILNNEQETAFNGLTGLILTKDQTYFFKEANTSPFIKDLNLFKYYLKTPLKTKTQFQSFEKNAHQLFTKLFPENSYQHYVKNKKVTFITDTQLENIALEALNTTAHKLTYLVNSTTIHYAYSMSFNEFNRQKTRNQNTDYCSFAPEQFKLKRLAGLPNSSKETTPLINATYEGSHFRAEEASKQNFTKLTEGSKIIHLATHASTEGEPTIYFQKDSLSLHELYSYKNNADLVVLSACETNLGAVKDGEGVLNLARGFFYSGANSVVSSLWKANNQSTANIMVDFYKNLTNHQSKATALTQAKRAYLKTHTLSEQSPFYWASFVLIGNAEPTFKKSLTPWIILGASILLFLLIGMVYKRLKTSNSK
ncbi:conserved exported hypothetical protein [Tenacibaculum litopenaei]|uniref:CHAT domain-containing protein n=1 Tax=Tenacibaculum litopenaei TaxID=396016 RepID=UPI0038951183